VETVLLFFTVILLLYSIREGHQRNRLMLEVSRATRTLTRIEYFQAVTDSLAGAEKEVIGCVTGHRLVTPEDKQRMQGIISLIERAVARGVTVRYLMPKFHDRLYMGYFYCRAGAEVRYSANDMVYSLRYNVVDESWWWSASPRPRARSPPPARGTACPPRSWRPSSASISTLLGIQPDL
jgi:hypothetical protein